MDWFHIYALVVVIDCETGEENRRLKNVLVSTGGMELRGRRSDVESSVLPDFFNNSEYISVNWTEPSQFACKVTSRGIDNDFISTFQWHHFEVTRP